MKDQIGNSLIESIGNDTLKSITKDYGELILDSLTSDETIKSIPIISTLQNLRKAGINLRDNILLKKILQFLSETESLGYREKKEFEDNVNHNSKYRTKVGEQLIIYLEKIDDFEKPIIIGKLFKNVVSNNIDYDTFLRLSSIVVRSFSPDLIALKEHSENTLISNMAKENLSNQGLLSPYIESKDEKVLSFDGIKDSNKNSIIYKLNDLSHMLINFGLK